MSSKKVFLISALSLLAFVLLYGAVGQNSLDYPVIFTTGTGSSGNAAPFLFIKNTSGYSYLVQTEGTSTDRTYSFEDADDYDFNDIVVRVYIENNNTDSPSIFVSHLQRDASYDHEIWLSVNIPSGYKAVYGGNTYASGSHNIKVFESSITSLGKTAEIKILPVDKFSLSVSPVSVVIPKNAAGEFKVEIQFKEGFSGDVALSTSGLPADTTSVFGINPVSGSSGDVKTSTLMVSAGTSAVSGDYDFTIHAETADYSREVSAHIKIVETPDFYLSINPPSIQIEAGKSAAYSISVSPSGGFDSRVNLSVEGLPEGFNAVLEPAWIVNEGKAVLTITTPSDAPAGKYNFSVKGSSGTTKHYCDASIDLITYTADMTIIKTSDKSTATSGEEVNFTIKCQNTGDVLLKNLIAKDSLESSFEFLSASPQFSITGSEISFALGDIAPGEAKTVSIKVKLTDAAEAAGGASNYAVASCDRIQYKRSNTVILQVGKPSLSLVKKLRNASPDFRPGGIVIYELIIKNRGSAPVFNIDITDNLPDGFFYIPGRTLVNGALASDPKASGTAILWEFDKLDNGKELDIVYQVSISAAVQNGRHVNSAVVTARDGAGRGIQAGPAQVLVTVSRGNILLYSTIEGTVFEDADNDGYFGVGDKPVQGVIILLEMGVNTKTGANGEYVFNSVLPGEHLLTIDTRSLPSDLEPYKKFYIANPLEGGKEYLDIPLKIKDQGDVKGELVWGDNVDLSITSFSLEGLKVLLDGKYYVLSDENGRFEFDGIPSGTHAISIPKESLPQGISVVSSDSLSIDVQRRTLSSVKFILNGNPYGSLEGRVVVSGKNTFGSSASITVEGIAFSLDGTAKIRSDMTGKFKFDKLLPGKYKLMIDPVTLEKLHYRLKPNQSLDFEIAAGKIQTIEIQLETLAFLEIKIKQ